MRSYLQNLQVKLVYQGYQVKVKITGAKKTWNLILPPHSVTDIAQSRCKCNDGKSISVIQGMTEPAYMYAGRRGAGGASRLQIADPQPAGPLCGLQISDPQTDRVMTERVYIFPSRVCLRLKAILFHFPAFWDSVSLTFTSFQAVHHLHFHHSDLPSLLDSFILSHSLCYLCFSCIDIFVMYACVSSSCTVIAVI